MNMNFLNKVVNLRILISVTFLIGVTIIISSCSSKDSFGNVNIGGESSYESEDFKGDTQTGVRNTSGYSENALNKTSDVSEKIEYNEEQVLEGKKIIKNGNIEIQTLEFDKTLSSLELKLKELGGYEESSNTSGYRINGSTNQSRNANLVYRIPSNKLDEFVKGAGTYGSIVNKNIRISDITETYYDSQARLKSLLIQEDRLLNILERLDNLKDIVELENELGKVRSEIETISGKIRRWDGQVKFSTLSIYVYEVYRLSEIKEQPKYLGERIINGFKSSVKQVGIIIEEAIVFIVLSIPYVIFISVFAIPLGIIFYKRKKRLKKISK